MVFAIFSSRYLSVGEVSELNVLSLLSSFGAGALPPFAIAPIMVSIWQGFASV